MGRRYLSVDEDVITRGREFLIYVANKKEKPVKN